MIIEPRWTRPEVRRHGDSLDVTIRGAVPGAKVLLILSDDEFRTRPAEPVEIHGAGNPDLMYVKFDVPESMPSGLYTTGLTIDGITYEAPSSVWIIDREPESFRFAHISDLHLMSTDGEVPEDRSGEIRALVEYLKNEVRPDFIINTGDVVSRYGPGKKLYTRHNVRRQIERAREILLAADIPQFISPGNHDKAFPYIRSAWTECMGAPENGTDDYSFDYGGVGFICLERSAAYNDAHEIINTQMTDKQLSWLRRQLDIRDAGSVLFCHYDYTGELRQFLGRSEVRIVLYGHSDQRWVPEAYAEKDGLLESTNACRIFDVESGELVKAHTIAKSELSYYRRDSRL